MSAFPSWRAPLGCQRQSLADLPSAQKHHQFDTYLTSTSPPPTQQLIETKDTIGWSRSSAPETTEITPRAWHIMTFPDILQILFIRTTRNPFGFNSALRP
jgi:hypothetical protein